MTKINSRLSRAKLAKVTHASAGHGRQELDGVYLLKMLLYILLGSMWLKISRGDTLSIPVPVGLLAGLLFTGHEHFRIDRKIEYAVLLVAMLIGYFAPYGLYVNFR